MMRVLWVTNMWPDERRPWYGSFVYSQAESLREIDIKVDVVYMAGYLRKREYLRGVVALHRATRTRSYDLVHAHYGHSGAVATLQRHVPVVISYCGDDLLGTPRADGLGGLTLSSRALAAAFAQLARVAQATITKSEEMADRLPPTCRDRNYIIPNGVDLARFAPRERPDARRQLGWDDTFPNVLFVGKPTIATKNFALAGRVCDELARRGVPVQLRVAANVEPSDMPVWMNAADVLLFTSLSEGSPNAVKEAMACELPIVSARVGDVTARLTGVAGTFVVDRDPVAMASAVQTALTVGRAPEARSAIAALSLERVASRIASIYESVSS